MSVSNEEINAWLQANAGASDATIAAAMNQYGVSTSQMAQATGLGQDAVQSRYDAVFAPQEYLAPTPAAATTFTPTATAVSAAPTINFTPGLASQTPEQKAAEYNTLRGQGFSDAQIKAAADATFGVQPESDWEYLTNLANQGAVGTPAATPTLTPTATVQAPLSMQDIANTPGLGATGIGTNNIVATPAPKEDNRTPRAPNPEVASQ